MKTRTYFPLQIRYTLSGKKRVVNSPGEIRSGQAFTVLATNVEEKK